MEVMLEFQARSYDIDFAGIVSNLVYHRWFEDLRLELLARVRPIEQLEQEGLVPTLVQALTDFREPLRLGERVRGRQALVRIRRTSLVLETEMRRMRDDAVIAVARHTMVFLNASTGRPVVVPDEWRAAASGPLALCVKIRGVD